MNTAAGPWAAWSAGGADTTCVVPANVGALAGAIPAEVFDRLTQISDCIVSHVPDEGNLFNHHP